MINKDKAILVVSFGTSYLDTLNKTIKKCEDRIKEAYKDYEVRRAFTSNMIIKKIKKRDNIDIDKPDLALEKLKKQGFKEVLMIPLHIMPGKEFEDVLEIYKRFKDDNSFSKLEIGRPLLYRKEDYFRVIEALEYQSKDLENKECLVFMGHGSYHPSNSIYSELQYILDMEGKDNYIIGTVEGFPEIEQVIHRIKNKGYKNITLVPFMLVCGDHAINDMAGMDEDSWLSKLKNEGFNVSTYLHGLGENELIQEIYLSRVKDAINCETLFKK